MDEYTAVVRATIEDVWAALLQTLDRSVSRTGASAYARMVGCREATASGPRPLAEGATIPGFRIAAATPGRELVLEGRHRFSAYALTFRIEEAAPGSSLLRVETRARFAGPPGRAYRLLVIGTGGHAVVVRRLLDAVRRRAEAGREPRG